MNSPIRHFGLLVSLSCLAAFAGACGRHLQRDAKNPEITRLYLTPTPPAEYFLANEGCQNTPPPPAPLSLNTLNFWGWDQSFQLSSLTAPDSHITSDESLVSPSVKLTRFGRQFLRSCDGKDMSRLCVNEDGSHVPYDIDPRDNFLKVCEYRTSFPRDSFENVALTSMLFIDRAARYYEQATQRKLEPVQLEVLPHFETLALDTPLQQGGANNVKLFITDNLAYYPQRHMIAIFPQSQTAVQQQLHRYWESSFVLAHELAHHVEELIGRGKSRIGGAVWNGPAHQFEGNAASINGTSASRMLQMSAVSEAFADLSAFYTVNEQLSGFANLDCVGANRDITKANFADGQTAKQLVSFTLNPGQSLAVAPTMRDEIGCNKVNFADPHIIGAIISYAINKALTVAVVSETADKRSQQKFRLALKWRTAMDVYFGPVGQQGLLTKLGTALERTLADANLSPSQKREICTMNRELLPISHPYAFEASCEQTRAAVN